MEQNKEEKTQSMFTPKGTIDTTVDGMTTAERRRHTKMVAALKKRDKEQAICPWCLYRGTLREFSRTNVRYEILKMTQCPDCYTSLREKSTRLVENLGPLAYSEWFWDNIYTWHGYERVGGDGSKESWGKLSGRVKDMGFQEIFWAVQRAKKMNREANLVAPQQSRRSFERSKMEYYKEKEAKRLGKSSIKERDKTWKGEDDPSD